MLRSRIAWLILLVTISFGVVQAQTQTLPGLLVYNAWLRPTAPTPPDGATPEAPIPGTVSGAYVTIENVGDVDYKLIGVDAGFAEMSMLHESAVDDKGVMQMRMVMGGLDIPPGETVQLAPGGYHAMLMNVIEDVYPGEAITLTLTFKDADGTTFEIPVGALVTDIPPEDDMLVASNPVAVTNDDGTLDVWLILGNRGDQDDMLTAASSDFAAATSFLQYDENRHLQPVTTVDIPASPNTLLGSINVTIHLRDLAAPPADAFPLTLAFASGKALTVAVPVAEAAA